MAVLYRGSVKNVIGPFPIKNKNLVLFEYTDAYSVFDWGRMPDVLQGKGEAQAVFAAYFFEKMQLKETWQEFSKSEEAFNLRKENVYGSDFNEYGEIFQKEGILSHYVGVLENLEPLDKGKPVKVSVLKDFDFPVRYLAVEQVERKLPQIVKVLDCNVPDYNSTWEIKGPRLVPLEVVFRFSCPKGSSLISRIEKNHDYLASIGFKGNLGENYENKLGFPILECFTKLESKDRAIGFSEALAISGISAKKLNEILFKTAWIASYLKYYFGLKNIELADGKFEWGIDETGKLFLVDSIGPDELRLVKNDMPLSKEFLRNHYRNTSWYEKVKSAQSKQNINMHWKRLVDEDPEKLPENYRLVATQLYRALVNEVTDRNWFPGAWTLDRVVDEMKLLN